MVLNRNITAALGAIVGEKWVMTDQDALSQYGRDTCDMFPAAPSAVVFPSNTKQVRQVVLLANEHSDGPGALGWPDGP